MPRTYQVPEEVSQHYPELIDDYIRAALTANAPQAVEPNYWTQGAGSFLESFNKNYGNYLAEESRGRLAEQAARRVSERTAATSRATEERQLKVQAEKDRLKQEETRREEESQQTGLTAFFRKLRGTPSEPVSPLEQTAGYLEDVVRGQGPSPSQLPENMLFQGGRRPGTPGAKVPMQALMDLYLQDPRAGSAAMRAIASLGEKGAGADIYKNLFEPGYAQRVLAQAHQAQAQAEATPERTEIQKRLADLEEEYKRARLELQQGGLAVRERGVSVEEGNLQRQRAMDEILAKLREAQTLLTQTRAEKLAEPKGDEVTAADARKFRREGFLARAKRLAGPNASPEYVQELAKEMAAFAPGTETSTFMTGPGIPPIQTGVTQRTPQGAPQPGSPTLTPREAFETIIGRSQSRAEAEQRVTAAYQEAIKQGKAVPSPEELRYLFNEIRRRFVR